MSRGYIIGVDIGGTNIRIGASDGYSELLHFQKTSSQELLTGEESVSNLVQFLKKYIADYFPKDEIEAVAIGLPSTLNKERDTVLQSPNLAGFDNVQLKKILENELNISVFVERDVNLLYCNDRNVLNLDRDGVHIGVYVGTGIGNAIFIDGEPLAGKDGAAGEIGHIPLVAGGKLCGCGNRGCAECYAAGKYLVELSESDFPGESISDIFVNHGKEAKLEEFVDNVARVTAMEINVLNPETIVLGGGVLNMKDFPRDLLSERILCHARKPVPADHLEIYYSLDAAENGVKGAIAYAREKMEQTPSIWSDYLRLRAASV